MLANVVRKPLAQIFSEFTGTVPMGDHYMGSGDVKYHLGTSYDRPTVSGKRVHLSLLANPSHLEARPPPCNGTWHAVAPSDMARLRCAMVHWINDLGRYADEGVVCVHASA